MAGRGRCSSYFVGTAKLFGNSFGLDYVMKIPQFILDRWIFIAIINLLLVIYNDNNTQKKGLFGVKRCWLFAAKLQTCLNMFYIPRIGCWEAAGRTESNDPMLATSSGECCWWWLLWSMDVRLEHPDKLPGDAKSSENAKPSDISDGAGVQGGVSMLGIGWSLKQADS